MLPRLQFDSDGREVGDERAAASAQAGAMMYEGLEEVEGYGADPRYRLNLRTNLSLKSQNSAVGVMLAVDVPSGRLNRTDEPSTA